MAIQKYHLMILAALAFIPFVMGAICDDTISDVIGIGSQVDADDIAGCGTVDADLEISKDYTGALILNGITTAAGSLIIQGATNLTSFAAPDLLAIKGNLTITSCILLSDLALDELILVGDMKLEDLPNLQSINFTSGLRTAGGISIVGTGLETLDGLEISSASDGINISANTALTDINFSSLTNTSGLLNIQANNPKMKVNLPSLAAVQDFTIENVSSFSMPGLYQASGQLLIAGSSIENFSTGTLQTGGSIMFIDNPLLNNISMPELTFLSGDLIIAANEELKQITEFSSLTKVQGNINVTGDYTEFTLPALTAVRGSFNATSESEFGGCATFEKLRESNAIQGNYTCSSPSGNPTSTISSTFTSSTSPEVTSTQSSGGSSSLLSIGAKVAIGVCVPVAVISFSSLLYFWWLRRRANARLAQFNGRQAHRDLTPRPELEGNAVATRPSQKQELDAPGTNITRPAQTLAPIELPNESESIVYHEMPVAPRENEMHQ